MLKSALKLTVTLKVAVIEILFKPVHLRLDFAQPGNSSERILQQRLLRKIRLRILPRPAYAGVGLDDQFAGIGRHFTERDLEKRRFAAAVRPYHADPVAGVDAERHVGKDVLMTVMNGNTLEVKHLNPNTSRRTSTTRYPSPSRAALRGAYAPAAPSAFWRV